MQVLITKKHKRFDYYAFGSVMQGRNYQTSSNFRFGFNGKENDNEVKGNGNSLDFGARIYDPRLGKWLSLDPLASKYPYYSPYVFVGNSPLMFIDPDGKRIIDINGNVIADINKETGKIEFSENLKGDARAVFEKVLSTEIGAKVLENSITASYDIKVIFDPATKRSNEKGETKKSEKQDQNYQGIQLGYTDSKETEDHKDFKSSTVTINKGSIKAAIKEKRELKIGVPTLKLLKADDYSSEEIGAGTLIHELTHATDKNSNAQINYSGSHEKNPTKNEAKYYNEIDTQKKK